MNFTFKYKVYFFFIVSWSIHFCVYSQQGYESALEVLEEFCDASTIIREDRKDISNITEWMDKSLENLFFSFGGYSMSSRNSSGFVPLVVHDDGNGINIQLYDEKVVFSPVGFKRKLTKNLTRNKYSFYTECELDIANYCNEDFVKSFDYDQRSYFEAGTYVYGLSLGQVIAHTINNFVEYDYKKDESAVVVFIKQINETQNAALEFPIDENEYIREFARRLTKKNTYNEILDLIYYTYIKKKNNALTDEALNKFYSKFVGYGNSDYKAYLDEMMSYKLNLGLKNGGAIKFSKSFIELVDSDTKEPIVSEEDYIELPIHNVAIQFAVDNTPRLIMTFSCAIKNQPTYKLNQGIISNTLIKGRFGRKKITKEDAVYANIDEIKVVFFNDRIQVIVRTAEYGSYHIINEKRDSLVYNEK